MDGYCEVCGKAIDIITCCDGYMCGCMGQPSEPPICDNKKCWEEFSKRLKPKEIRTIQIKINEN